MHAGVRRETREITRGHGSPLTRIPAGYDTFTGEVKAWDYKVGVEHRNHEEYENIGRYGKAFAKKAVEGIREIVEEAGGELALLEKYTDKVQLLEAVAEADALIVRSDKVTAEVIAAARRLRDRRACRRGIRQRGPCGCFGSGESW